ncbi:MAG TPA: phosphate signaling complex protein PhoU [Coleofasciculaceae cyanobacterium]|jgi:phosphate transport system protein
MTRHLDREIERLKDKITDLSRIAEERVQQAVTSLEERDAALARSVIEGDEEIDHMEVEVEEDCLKILALHQPVANDLRFIIAILKINNDLERICDLAANIAERAMYLTQHAKIGIPFDLLGMARKVQIMLRDSLESLVNQDTDLARKVCGADQEVDVMHRDIYERVEAAMREQPDSLGYLITLLIAARHLERIADHATNIAEDVLYLVEGEIQRHQAANATNPGTP